ncbi:unnamed protein product [Arctogadus glacialis]
MSDLFKFLRDRGLPKEAIFLMEEQRMAGLDIGCLRTVLELTRIIGTLMLACHGNACIQFPSASLRDFPDNGYYLTDSRCQYSLSMLQTILKCWLLATDQRGIPKDC